MQSLPDLFYVHVMLKVSMFLSFSASCCNCGHHPFLLILATKTLMSYVILCLALHRL